MSTHIFEPITERFGYGNYLDLKIIIDSKTKYINATKLCQLGNKHLRYWQRTDSSKELIDTFNINVPGADLHGAQVSYEIKQKDLKGLPRTDQEIILGTYYHRDLIVHLAQWISPAFAFKVSKIVNDYIGYENKRKIRELKGENKTLLDKVDDLSKQNIDLKKQNEEVLAATRTLITMGNEQLTKIDSMSAEISRIRHHLDNETSKPNKRELILVYRNKDDPKAVMRIRAGTEEYIKKFRRNAVWYREYSNISNSKKAINYMKDNGMITFEKGKTTKTIIHDINERNHLRQCLKKLDESYA
jgi:hypothetical protein